MDGLEEKISVSVSRSLDKKIENCVAPLTKRQDEFESKTDSRLTDIENHLSDLSQLLKSKPPTLPQPAAGQLDPGGLVRNSLPLSAAPRLTGLTSDQN